jgi:hypothetical protein
MTVRRKIFFLMLVALCADASRAQTPRAGRRGPPPAWNENESGEHYVRLEGGILVDEDAVHTAREVGSHSTGTPEWKNPRGFERDVFTFARVIFRTQLDLSDGYNYQGRLGWWVDFPDADLNFSSGCSR